MKRQEATIVRPDSLAAGLLRCSFELDDSIPLSDTTISRSIVKDIPASLTVFNVLGLIARLFAIQQAGHLELVVAEQVLTQESRPLAMLIEGSFANIKIRWNQDRIQEYTRHKALINGY